MSKSDKSTKKSVAVSRLAATAKTLKSPVAKTQFTMAPQTGGQRHLTRKEEKTAIKEFDPVKSDGSLKKKSPWYASIHNPVQGGGAKIPDTVGINTATMQLVQKISVPVNANGCAGFEVTTPYINSISGGQNYRTSAASSTALAMAWNTATGFSNQSSMQSVAQSHRVVSGAVYAEYEGTTLQDSGDVTTYVRPGVVNALTSLPLIQALYGSSVVPVNKARSKPVVTKWFPINVNNQSYKDFQSPNFSSFGIGAVMAYTLGVFFQGLPASVGSVVFTIAVNYEFVPSVNTIDFISPDPSPIDPIEEQLVQQWIQEDTQTGLSSNRLVDVQPGSQVVEAASQGINADSGFGMLGSIIKELVPIGLALL